MLRQAQHDTLPQILHLAQNYNPSPPALLRQAQDRLCGEGGTHRFPIGIAGYIQSFRIIQKVLRRGKSQRHAQ